MTRGLFDLRGQRSRRGVDARRLAGVGYPARLEDAFDLCLCFAASTLVRSASIRSLMSETADDGMTGAGAAGDLLRSNVRSSSRYASAWVVGDHAVAIASMS